LLSPSKFISKKGEKLIGNGMKKFLLFAIFLISFSFMISSVKAVTYISDCSDLNQSGETYYLTADIIDSSISPCINISANNVILDCQGHIIDGDDVAEYGIYVYRSEITTTNITIKNCILSNWATAGIYLFSSSNNQIINSTSNSNYHGIYLDSSSNNQIINSTSNSNYHGIYLDSSSNNQIINSTFNYNSDTGIYLDYSSNNQIINSTSNSNYYGIYLLKSSNNQIINSTSNSNYYGIYLKYSFNNNQIINSTSNSNYYGIYLKHSSNNNQIINSTFNYNSDTGIYLDYSSDNQIINSTFLNNDDDGVTLESSDYNKFENIYLSGFQDSSGDGIFYIGNSNYNNITNITIANASASGFYIVSSNNNAISYSKIMNCGNCGIYFYSQTGQNNLIYNNLFNNTNNFCFDGIIYSNYWNTTKQSGQRIYSPGNYIGGNYWTNSTGNAYSDICADDDKDGFCDLPYDLLGDGTNVDYLPLSDEYSPNLPPEITIFSPLNQSYYGSTDFVFKATDDLDKNFTVRTYLNNQLEYENLYYQNNTQTSYSKSLPTGTYNFTVYTEDSHGNSLQKEVIFTSLGYCGDSICQADYENSSNCFKDCGGASKNFVFLVVVGLGIMGIVFGRDFVVGTKTTEEMVRTFVVILIILVVIGIIASTWL